MRNPIPSSCLSVLVATQGFAQGDPQIQTKTATTHPMQYFLSLPKGWNAARTWPVVVVIPDATRDFKGNLEAFIRARKDLPFILVAPQVLTCGGSSFPRTPTYPYSDTVWKGIESSGHFTFDEAGIAAVMTDVQKQYHAESRYFLTGWEAGGHTVWAMIFRHSDLLRGAAPVSTNYKGRWFESKDISTAPARARLPVTVLFCDQLKGPDEAGRQNWLLQTKEAMELAKTHGFTRVSLHVAAGRPHGPLAEEVLAAFATTLAEPADKHPAPR